MTIICSSINTSCLRAVSKGVTLIELLMVVAIIGIMISIGGLGLMQNLPSYRLKSAVRDLISNIQMAKVGAIKENKDWAIVFDPSNSRYLVCSDNGADNDWGQVADNEVEKTVNLISAYDEDVDFGHGSATEKASTSSDPVDDEISFSGDRIEWDSRGMTSFLGYVYFENSLGETYAVGTRLTGAIVLRKWTGSDWEDL